MAEAYTDFESPDGLYLNGSPVPESYYETICDNIRNAHFTKEIPHQFGFAVSRTIMRDYSYDAYLSDNPSATERD